MSGVAMSAQIRDADLRARLELANRICGHAALPKKALGSIFEGAIKQLEKVVNTKFDSILKGRVWNKVSKKPLKFLKEQMLSEFCYKILGGFEANQIDRMLDEHRRTGFIRHGLYSVQINTAYQLHYSEIVNSVVEKAKSIIHEWIPRIVDAVREEDIAVPTLRE